MNLIPQLLNSFLADLRVHQQYANPQVIRSFVVDGFCDEEGIRLFSHPINVHHMWRAFMQEKTPIFDIWETHLLNSFSEVDNENQRRSFELLEEISGLEVSIRYTNSQGQHYSNSYRNIFLHIIKHSTDHRAQLARVIHFSGRMPPVTDYIYYQRAQH